MSCFLLHEAFNGTQQDTSKTRRMNGILSLFIKQKNSFSTEKHGFWEFLTFGSILDILHTSVKSGGSQFPNTQSTQKMTNYAALLSWGRTGDVFFFTLCVQNDTDWLYLLWKWNCLYKRTAFVFDKPPLWISAKYPAFKSVCPLLGNLLFSRAHAPSFLFCVFFLHAIERGTHMKQTHTSGDIWNDIRVILKQGKQSKKLWRRQGDLIEIHKQSERS